MIDLVRYLAGGPGLAVQCVWRYGAPSAVTRSPSSSHQQHQHQQQQQRKKLSSQASPVLHSPSSSSAASAIFSSSSTSAPARVTVVNSPGTTTSEFSLCLGIYCYIAQTAHFGMTITIYARDDCRLSRDRIM